MDSPTAQNATPKPEWSTVAKAAVVNGEHQVRKNQLVSILAWLHPELSVQEISLAFDRIE